MTGKQKVGVLVLSDFKRGHFNMAFNVIIWACGSYNVIPDVDK
jgi:hypothetical protein